MQVLDAISPTARRMSQGLDAARRHREAQAKAKKRRRRALVDRCVVTVLLLATVVLSIYPVVGTLWNDYKAWEFAREADHRLALGAPAPDHSQLFADAHAYNEALSPTVLGDPWTASTPDSPEYREYLAQMALGPTMGSIRIPDIDVELSIMHGTTEEVLRRGAGHVYGTSLPVGGESTHAAISAHRGLPHLSAFDSLPELEVGDQFFIDSYGQTLAYQVRGTEVVEPHEIERLKVVEGQDLVTLITCTPYAINSHRLLVTAERIPWSEAVNPEAAEDPGGFTWSIQDWMHPRLIIAGLTLALLVALAAAWTTNDARAHLARRRVGLSPVPAQPTERTNS